MARDLVAKRIHEERIAAIAAGADPAEVYKKRPRDRRKVIVGAWPKASVQWHDEETNRTLIRITDPDELMQFGHVMGHCAGAHTKYACITPIEHFLTIIDAEGKPHGTLQLKDVEWYRKSHPDDDLIHTRPRNIYHTRAGEQLGPLLSGGYAKGDETHYFKSTAYDYKSKSMTEPVFVDGHVAFVILCADYESYTVSRDPWHSCTYRISDPLIQAWYDSATVKAVEAGGKSIEVLQTTRTFSATDLVVAQSPVAS